ncbi:MAG: DUF1893 domain-containing protein [Nitrososphaerota archaeon]
MLSDLMLARRTLAESGANMVIARGGEIIFMGWSKGLRDLAKIALTSPGLLEGSSVADKIVGKAVAVICSMNGVKAVYAQLMSSPALEELERSGIETHYERLAPYIETPSGEICPFEKLIMHLGNRDEAYRMLLERFRKLGWG